MTDIDRAAALGDARILEKGSLSTQQGLQHFIADYLERSDKDALAVGDVVNLLYILSGGDIIDPSALQSHLGEIGYNYSKYLGGEYAVFWGWTMRPCVFEPTLSTEARSFIKDRGLRVSLSAWISDEDLAEEFVAWGKSPQDTLIDELRDAFLPYPHERGGILGLMAPARMIDGNFGEVSPGGQKLFARCILSGLLTHIYENQTVAASCLGITRKEVTTMKVNGVTHGGRWLLQGVDSLAEWEKSMILTLAPLPERSLTDNCTQTAISTVKIVQFAPTVTDAIAFQTLRNKGKDNEDDMTRFLDDCFVHDATGAVFTTQVAAVYKIWATKAKKKHVDRMLEKVKAAFPDKAKLGFGAGMGQRKLAIQGVRLKTIYHVSFPETDFDRFIADRLVVDCIARVHKAVLLNEFAEWYKAKYGRDVANVTKAEFLTFCSNKFIQARAVYEETDEGSKKQQPGFLGIGLKSTAAYLTGTHSRSATRPGVTFRSIVTEATLHFQDEREAAVRFNIQPEGIAKLRRKGGLILGRYREVEKQEVRAGEDQTET